MPQYKMHLNRFLALVVPMIAMFLPYTVIKASETIISSQIQNDSSQDHQIKVSDGLDTENKTITISDTDFYAWIVQLNLYPDKYEGYTLHVHGTVYRNDYMEENEFAVT